MFKRMSGIVGVAAVALAIGLGGAAQARNGADDPAGHHREHHGKHHHQHRHHHNDDGANHH